MDVIKRGTTTFRRNTDDIEFYVRIETILEWGLRENEELKTKNSKLSSYLVETKREISNFITETPIVGTQQQSTRIGRDITKLRKQRHRYEPENSQTPDCSLKSKNQGEVIKGGNKDKHDEFSQIRENNHNIEGKLEDQTIFLTNNFPDNTKVKGHTIDKSPENDKQSQSDSSETKEELEELRDENTNLTIQLKDKNNELTQCKKQIEVLETDISNIKDEMKNLHQEKTKMSAELQERIRDLSKTQQLCDTLQQENQQFENKLESANQQILQASKDFEQMEQGKVHSDSVLAQLADEMKEAENKIDLLTKQKAEVEAILEEKSREVTKMKKELGVLKSNVKLITQVEERNKRTVCLLCTNEEKLRQVANALHNMIIQEEIPEDVVVIKRRLTGTLSANEGDIVDANMIILIAVAEGRNMIISDSEPSQLGAIYRETIKQGKDVLMIYVNHKYQDSLKDNQVYHSSLAPLFENQKAVGDLEKRGRFMSVKYKEKERIQKLNPRQVELVSRWIKDCMQI